MFCVKCGAKLQEGALFCSHCGSKTGVQTDAAENVTPAPEEKRISREASALVAEKNGVPNWFLGVGILQIAAGVIGLLVWIPDFIRHIAIRSYYRSSYMSSSILPTLFFLCVDVLVLIMGILWIKAPLSMKNNVVRVFTDKVQLQCVDSPVEYNQILKHAFIGGSTRSINVVVMLSEISAVSCLKTGAIRFLEIETKGGNTFKVLINDAEELANIINQCLYGF